MNSDFKHAVTLHSSWTVHSITSLLFIILCYKTTVRRKPHMSAIASYMCRCVKRLTVEEIIVSGDSLQEVSVS